MYRTPPASMPLIDDALSAQVPLVVDLHGTLLRSDTLVESLLSAARTHPLSMLGIPLWLAQGRARLKQALAERAALNVRTLPLDPELLDHLRVAKRQGRRLILASGADEKIARAVADETGLFDAVMASNGVVNLTASHKRERLVSEVGERGFDYIGNSARDLPIWSAARRGLLMTPLATPDGSRTACHRGRAHFCETAPRHRHLPLCHALEPLVENVLLLVPLLVEHRLYDPTS